MRFEITQFTFDTKNHVFVTDYAIAQMQKIINRELFSESGAYGRSTTAVIYQATVEDASRTVETQLFTNIPETESLKPTPGFDTDNNNAKVTKLFNASGNDKRTGSGIVLKVMAGDKFKALVNGWYQPGSTNTSILPGATDNNYVTRRSAINEGSRMSIVFRAIHTVTGTDANTAWNLKISVTNPKFELNPYKSIKSNISH